MKHMGLASMVTLVFLVGQHQASAQVSRASTVKENRAFVYHGKLVRPDGSVPNGPLPVTLKIYSPDPSLCLLWQESQTVEFTNGGFSVELGHIAHRKAGSAGGAATDFKQSFINNSSLVIPSAQCASGNSYTPQAADDRLLFASIVDGASTIEVAAIPIKSVPFALQAEEIGGYGLANLMKISGAGSSVTYSPNEIQSLKDLLGNDINWDMKSRKIQNLADPTAATDAATRGWVISQINSSGGGTISSIGFTAPSIFSVANAPLTADGTIAMTLATQAANQVFAGPSSGADAAPTFRTLDPLDIPNLDAAKITTGTFSAARIPNGIAPGGAAAGDLSGTYPNPTVAKINGVAVSSTAPTSASQVLKYNGTTQYAPAFVGVSDIRSTATGNAAFFPTNCTSAQTTVWNSITDVMDCTNISLTSTNVTFGSQTQNQFFAAPSGASGAPTFRAMVAADVPSLDWSKIGSGKPTTLSGYGITDNLVSNLGGSPGIQSGVDASKPGAPTAGTIYFATDTRIIYQFNSGAWVAISQASGSAPGGSATGDLSGTYPAPAVAKIQGNAVASTTLIAGDAGKSYVWNGTSLTAKYFGIADLKNAAGTSYYPQCTASQTLTWVSATDTLTCSSIAIGDSAVTYASQTQNKVFASPDGTSGAPTYRALVAADIPGLPWSQITSGKPTTISGFGITDNLVYNGGQAGAVSLGSNDANSVTLKANNSAAMTILSSGNVGVGTTSPSEKFEVVGNIKGTQLCIGTDCRATWPAGGGGSWTASGSDVYFNTGSVGIGTTSPAAKLDVAGGIKVGTTSTCTATEEGTLRYNSTSKGMEFCNGSAWSAVGSTGGGGGLRSCSTGNSNDVMVAVGSWCVDKYEASVWSVADGTGTGFFTDSTTSADTQGNMPTGAANYPAGCNRDGSGCAQFAASKPGVIPARGMTWYQAARFCANAGKMMIPDSLWQAAAIGTVDPGAGSGTGGTSGGSATDAAAAQCNINTHNATWTSWTKTNNGVRLTSRAGASSGGTNACVSDFGVEDMVGNLWEWTDMNGAQAGADQTAFTQGEANASGGPFATADGTWNIHGSAYGCDGAGTSLGTCGWKNNTPAAALRGGSWSNGTGAGVTALILYYSGSYSFWHIGFRCARPR